MTKLIKFKVVKQTPGYCGPSCAKMVLDYYGFEKTEEELANIIGATRKNGCTPQKIIKGMKKLGFNAYYKKNSSIEELKELLEKDIPVIIYWDKDGHGHYSVVMGVNNKNICVADPENKEIVNLKKDSFLKRWIDVDTPRDKHEIIVIERKHYAALV